jgi:DNA-directed RNA polymerase subunit M/transcription elongation factor TFIIS
MMRRIRITSGDFKGRYIGGPFSGWGLITNPEARVNPPVNITGVPYALHATEQGATQFFSGNTEGVRAELKALGYESEAVEEVVAPRQNYVKIPTECPHCNAKQAVHFEALTRFAQMGGPLPVVCAKCEKGFEISVPDSIIGDSFQV